MKYQVNQTLSMIGFANFKNQKTKANQYPYNQSMIKTNRKTIREFIIIENLHTVYIFAYHI